MVYDDLIKQFEDLSDDDKNILLVYKSKLGVAINSLDNDNEKVLEIYNSYKKLLDNPKNIFMKMTVFKDISFDNEISFSESLTNIKDKLLKISTSLTISNDLTVYRIVSVPSFLEVSDISLDNIISTSININTCLKFLIKKDNYKHYLYQINLPKNSPLAICPYAILYNKKEEQLILTKNSDQEEIILNKDSFTFNSYSTSHFSLDNGLEVNVNLIDSMIKIKDDKKIR